MNGNGIIDKSNQVNAGKKAICITKIKYVSFQVIFFNVYVLKRLSFSSMESLQVNNNNYYDDDNIEWVVHDPSPMSCKIFFQKKFLSSNIEKYSYFQYNNIIY